MPNSYSNLLIVSYCLERLAIVYIEQRTKRKCYVLDMELCPFLYMYYWAAEAFEELLADVEYHLTNEKTLKLNLKTEFSFCQNNYVT